MMTNEFCTHDSCQSKVKHTVYFVSVLIFQDWDLGVSMHSRLPYQCGHNHGDEAGPDHVLRFFLLSTHSAPMSALILCQEEGLQ